MFKNMIESLKDRVGLYTNFKNDQLVEIKQSKLY
jgi:hypothetical protein